MFIHVVENGPVSKAFSMSTIRSSEEIFFGCVEATESLVRGTVYEDKARKSTGMTSWREVGERVLTWEDRCFR